VGTNECEDHLLRQGRVVITVRIAHAEPRSWRLGGGGQPAGQPGEACRRGLLVALADDAGHRVLPVWLAEDPDGVWLPGLLFWCGDGMGTMAGVPEELAARLVSAAGASVTGVELDPAVADVREVTGESFAARVELGGLPGARHVTTRLDTGLALAVVTRAPVRVPGPMMDRLAVPVPDGGLLALFRDRGLDAAGPGHVVLDRGAGPVVHVRGDGPGSRPRFEPRNMDFGHGLDRWDLDGGPGQEAGSPPPGYSAAAQGRCAVLSSAAAGPGDSAVLVQAVFADDFLGVVVFGGEVRTEGEAGRAGLCLEILRAGKGSPDRREEHHAVTVTGSQDWCRQEITVPVPEDAGFIRFGIVLAGRGRVWLRNPELRRETPDDTEEACGG
jgi:hypothetical protein